MRGGWRGRIEVEVEVEIWGEGEVKVKRLRMDCETAAGRTAVRWVVIQ